MGCDIHAYIEYKFSDCGYTEVFSTGEIHFGRDYELFGLIAGVRSSSFPIFLTRGFPDSTAPMPSNWYVRQKYEEFGKDAHSATWLSLPELKTIRSHYLKAKILFNSVVDPTIKSLVNNTSVTNDIVTYSFGEIENLGLYSSIVVMESLEKLHKNLTTRLVCWFDS